MYNKTVCVIGLGYIGLPTAALLANKGFKVVGIDNNSEVIRKINNGEIHIVEADLGAYVKSATSRGYLRAFNKVQKSDIYMICVPTPFKKSKIPQPNLEHVLSVTRSLAPLVKKGDLIILESTSPVGTTQIIQETLEKNGANLKGVHIAYCPERVLPGKIMIELVENDRIIGGLSSLSTKKISEFYRCFINGDIIQTDAKTAEMCKLAENSFRDINIAFANELSIICEEKNIDVWELIRLANKHPRVNILQPGTGVGGHCIAVDPWFIISQNPEKAKLMLAARKVNNLKTFWVLERITNIIKNQEKKNKDKPKIACLGIAFKPDIDDLRESAALKIVETLVSKGHQVLVVEPNISTHDELEICNLMHAIEEADIICILVKHKEFLNPDIKTQLIKNQANDFCGALV